MPSWQNTAAKKKQDQSDIISKLGLSVPQVPSDVLNVAKIPLGDVLGKEALEITDTADVGILLSKIASGTWSSVAVIKAYIHRAVIAHALTNCLTEIFVDKALERAKQLDAHLAKTGKVVGPLHGLPISLKDQIEVKGVETNMGYVAWVGEIASKDSAMAEILLQQGAVLYVKTNIPQSLMSPESNNAVWGRTVNPRNRKLTCGGSSGGEGALVAMRGSPLGVGSDVGGSVRIPSAFNGLYGLRTSYHRVPYEGTRNSMQGFEVVPSVLGPISSSVNGLKIFLQAVLAGEPWNLDPLVRHQPWDEAAYNLRDHGGKAEGKLCFALMKDDGVCLPMPPYRRALEMTRKAVEKAGHKVVDWELPDNAEGEQLIMRLYTADGGKDIGDSCARSGEPRLGWLMEEAQQLSTSEYWQLTLTRREYLKKRLDAWQATSALTGTGRPFDGIIMPPSSNCPEQHDQSQHIWWTSMCNLADYPAAVFPVTAVDPQVDVKVPAHKFRSAIDRDIFERYDPKTYQDAPISLQIVAQKGEEEAVIRMVEIIDAALQSHK